MSAYFVFHNRVHDKAMLEDYVAKVGSTLAGYQVEVLVLDSNSQVIEGDPIWPRTVVIRFDTRENAMAWYNSPAYQKVLPLRLNASEGFGVLVDGFSG